MAGEQTLPTANLSSPFPHCARGQQGPAAVTVAGLMASAETGARQWASLLLANVIWP